MSIDLVMHSEDQSQIDLRASLPAPEPLYKQVKQRIVRSLVLGEWKPGERLPIASKLAVRYGVGISTIKVAISELVAAKMLARTRGKGTLVSLQDDRHYICQFFHVVRDDGAKELPISKLLWLKKGKAPPALADMLMLPRTAKRSDVFRLRNVSLVNGTPVAVSDIVIPAALFPGLTERLAQIGGKTLYGVYQIHFGVNIARTEEKLCAVRAEPSIANILGLAPGDPVLEVRRTAYTFESKPVEVRRSRVLTQKYCYLVEKGTAE